MISLASTIILSFLLTCTVRYPYWFGLLTTCFVYVLILSMCVAIVLWQQAIQVIILLWIDLTGHPVKPNSPVRASLVPCPINQAGTSCLLELLIFALAEQETCPRQKCSYSAEWSIRLCLRRCKAGGESSGHHRPYPERLRCVAWLLTMTCIANTHTEYSSLILVSHIQLV